MTELVEPTAPIGWECAERLVDMLRAAPGLDGVQVEDGWPGEKRLRAECVYIDAEVSELSVPVSTGPDGRLVVDDEFLIAIGVRVSGQRDLRKTRRRLSVLIGAIHGVVAVGVADLEGLPGVISATPSGLMATAVDTPAHGPVGYGRYDVDAHTRIA